MSIREHIASLEELSDLDQEIRVLDDRLSHDRETLSELKSALTNLEARVSTDTATLSEMIKTRNEVTHEVRQMTAQIEHSREKLGRARNEREQNAATREVEELRRLQKDREDEVTRLAALEAAAQKSKDEAETERQKVLDQLSKTEGSTSANIGETETQRASKIDARKRVAANLPRPLLSRYETIRTRRGIAIALTQNGTCLACHMALPPQLFQKILRDEAVELCPNCNRILYYKPPMPKADS